MNILDLIESRRASCYDRLSDRLSIYWDNYFDDLGMSVASWPDKEARAKIVASNYRERVREINHERYGSTGVARRERRRLAEERTRYRQALLEDVATSYTGYWRRHLDTMAGLGMFGSELAEKTDLRMPTTAGVAQFEGRRLPSAHLDSMKKELIDRLQAKLADNGVRFPEPGRWEDELARYEAPTVSRLRWTDEVLASASYGNRVEIDPSVEAPYTYGSHYFRQEYPSPGGVPGVIEDMEYSTTALEDDPEIGYEFHGPFTPEYIRESTAVGPPFSEELLHAMADRIADGGA